MHLLTVHIFYSNQYLWHPKHSCCLQALIDTNDHEIFLSLTSCYNEKYQRQKGAVGTQLAGERAQIILDEVRALLLLTRSQCLEHIGTYILEKCFLRMYFRQFCVNYFANLCGF